MGFKVLAKNADGEVVVLHEITDRRVTRVGLVGRTGEAGAMGVPPDQTEVLLTFDYAPANGVPTLQDLEEITHPSNLTGDDVSQRQDALSQLQTSTNTGQDVLLKSAEEEAEREEVDPTITDPEASDPEASDPEPDFSFDPDLDTDDDPTDDSGANDVSFGGLGDSPSLQVTESPQATESAEASTAVANEAASESGSSEG